MVTRNQLRLTLFNALHGSLLSQNLMDELCKKLSEEELGALVAMFIDNAAVSFPDLKLQEKLGDCQWLVNIAQKYNQVLKSLRVNFITQGLYVSFLDKILAYLAFRRQISDTGCLEIFEAVHEYVRMLRCKCDMSDISVLPREHKMLEAIIKSTEPELNARVASLLCYFSFDENHTVLVNDFWCKKHKLISSYLEIANIERKHNFIL